MESFQGNQIQKKAKMLHLRRKTVNLVKRLYPPLEEEHNKKIIQHDEKWRGRLSAIEVSIYTSTAGELKPFVKT